MELAYRPVIVKKADVKKNPSRYYVLDGRSIPSALEIPLPIRDILTPQLTGGFVKPVPPTNSMSNEFCTIISSPPAKVPGTNQLAEPYFAFLPPVTEQLSYGKQFMADPNKIDDEHPFYIGFVMQDHIPELAPKVVNLVTRIHLSKGEKHPLENVVNLVPFPAEFQLFGTHDFLEPGMDESELTWEPIGDRATVPADAWSINAPSPMPLGTNDENRHLVTYHGFKFVVYKWHMEHCDVGDDLPGVCRIQFVFDGKSIDTLKCLSVTLPNAHEMGEIHLEDDEVLAYDLENLSNDSVPETKAFDCEKMKAEIIASVSQSVEEKINDLFQEKTTKLASEITSATKKLQEAVMDEYKKLSKMKIDVQGMTEGLSSLTGEFDARIAEFNRTLDTRMVAFEDKLASLNNIKAPTIDEAAIEKMVLKKIKSQEADYRNKVVSTVNETMTAPTSPVSIQFQAVLEAMKKYDVKLDELESQCVDVVSAILLDNLPGRSYPLSSVSDNHHYMVSNKKAFSTHKLQCVLPANAPEGKRITVSNFRTDGGEVMILPTTSRITVIGNGKAYYLIPSVTLTNYGEAIELHFLNGVWHGRVTDGVIPRRNAKK